MHVIPNKVDFYITNVCNLTCKDCNRFNNHKFTGWQNWADYEQDYERWSQLVELTAITIMGGEPFLNPSLAAWVTGLNRIFGISVEILTNGTRLGQSCGVYDALLWTSRKTGMQNHIGVSLHNTNDYDMLHANIMNFLKGPVTVLPKSKNRWGSDWNYRDSNGVEANLYLKNEFTPSAIRTNVNGRYILHDSTPAISHNACAFAQWKSYHFIRGGLYKCGPAALLPEFDLQHTFEMSEEDCNILHSYKPLTTANFQSYSEEFFRNLDNPIAQCKFCPEGAPPKIIWPIRKGSS